MRRYLYIALAVVTVALVLPLSLKGCSLTVPAPPNQTASQKASCFGFIVSNACNQTINQGQPQQIDWQGLTNFLLLVGISLGVFAVAGCVVYFFAFRRGNE